MNLNKSIQIYEENNSETYMSMVNLKSAVLYLDNKIKDIDDKIEKLAKGMDSLCANLLSEHLKGVKKDVLEEKEKMDEFKLSGMD